MSTPLQTRPPDSAEKALREKYAQAIADQADLMDRLAQQLLIVELAIPGLYAAVLTLVHGGDATLLRNWWLYVIFGGWFGALLLTLAALFPRKWRVDPMLLDGDVLGGTNADGSLSIKEFFVRSANYKRRLLFSAVLLVSVGIFGAVVLALQ